MATTNITTCLDNDLYAAAKATGLKWNQLIRLGVTAHKNHEMGIIQQMKDEHNALMEKFNRLASRLFELEEQNKKTNGVV